MTAGTSPFTLSALEDFVVRAKKATYVANGQKASPSRPGSIDLSFTDGQWAYADSYFGGTDFLGQEVVWFESEAVWAMNYHGYILRPDLIDGSSAARIMRSAHHGSHSQGRLLDNFNHDVDERRYSIRASGRVEHFTGQEEIAMNGVIVYQLIYHGGLIKP